MGKKRIVLVSEIPETPEKPKKERKPQKEEVVVAKKATKSGKQHGHIADVSAETLAEAEVVEKKAKELEKDAADQVKKTTKKVKKNTPVRGKKYQEKRKLVDRTKTYPLTDAIKLLKRISISQFNGSVDAHFNLTSKSTGLKGEITFPHPTGKKQNIKIADEKLIAQLEKGKIDFTALVTTPAMMPKLAKYARLLGPRGLMPNPKTGTITDKPEELVKKLAGSAHFKTEAKAPLIHMSIGKVDSPEKDLLENFKALIKAIGRKNIKKTVISPTMGPGIKVNLTGL